MISRTISWVHLCKVAVLIEVDSERWITLSTVYYNSKVYCNHIDMLDKMIAIRQHYAIERNCLILNYCPADLN